MPTLAPGGSKDKKPKELTAVSDKGLRDPKSFMQQMYNTMSMKMVEWVGLPPPPPLPAPKLELPAVEIPHEPPKLKFPDEPMDVMDTGRVSRDSDPVSQILHQDILQQPRRRGMKDGALSPHSKKLTTPGGPFVMAPPPNPPPIHRKDRKKEQRLPHETPSCGRKDSEKTSLMDSTPEEPKRPQTVIKIDEEIIEALAGLSFREDSVKAFHNQSVFYVFSKPKALLASFGGMGNCPDVKFNPETVDRCIQQIYFRLHISWGYMRDGIWQALAHLYTKPGCKGLSDRDAAGVVAIAFHMMSFFRGGVEIFDQLCLARAMGTHSGPGNRVLPDIWVNWFDDDGAKRLAKRVIRAIAFRIDNQKPVEEGEKTFEDLVKGYLKRCYDFVEKERAAELRKLREEIGVAASTVPKTAHQSRGRTVPRCVLEWARNIFMESWNGNVLVHRDTLHGVALSMLRLLFETDTVERDLFHTPMVTDRIDPYVLPIEWYRRTKPLPEKTYHLLDFPFLIELSTAVTFLRSIHLDLMKKAYESAFAHYRLTIQMSKIAGIRYPDLADQIPKTLTTYLVIHTRRKTIVEDTMNHLLYREKRELLRPLKVKFAEGEDGIDQGGVQQEFYGVLMQTLMDPEYGMFMTDETTRISWFNTASLEGLQKFELMGLIFGLAVYNGVTVPVNFPKVLYAKLLGWEITLDDIEDAWPQQYRSLKYLLECPEEDVEDLCLQYEFYYDVFGQKKSVDMIAAKANGVEHLDRPIKKLNKLVQIAPKDGNRERRRRQRGEGLVNSWTLIPPVEPEDAGWLGSLANVMQEVMDAQVAQEERQTGEGRSYTVSFRDLNEPDSEEEPEVEEAENRDESTVEDGMDAWGTVGLEEIDAAMRTPLPPDDDNLDAYASSPSSEDMARAGLILEEFAAEPGVDRGRHRPPPLSSHARQVSFTRDDLDSPPSAPSPPPRTGPPSPRSASPSSEVSDNDKDEEPESDPEDSSDDAASTSSLGPVSTSSRISRASSLRAPAFSTAATMGSSTASLGNRSLSPTSPTFTLPSTHSDLDPPDDDILSPLSTSPAPSVTSENRNQYVADYLLWLHTRSIAPLFTAFARGFHSLPLSRTLSLLTPQMLQLLLQGTPTSTPISVADLKAITIYDDGCELREPDTIRWFWETVEEMDEDMKRRLLEFVTSSGRLPVGGVKGVSFHLAVVGGEEGKDGLPMSYTCFGRLMLPRFSSKERCRWGVRKALEFSRGFGTL